MTRLITLLIALFALSPAAAHAAEVKVAGGVLTYTDSAANARNIVAVNLAGSSYSVTETGTINRSRIPLTSDGSCTVTTSRTTSTATCPMGGVSAFELRLGALDDRATISDAITVPARLFGEAGNDRLAGGGGDDTLDGGPGGDGLIGGPGRDTADYSARSAPVTVVLNNAPDDGEADEKDGITPDTEVVAGGSAGDNLTGGEGDTTLLGNGGNDTLVDGAGNDQLEGGAGDDVLAGGAGADALSGGDGIDTASYADHGQGVRVLLDGQPGDGNGGENDNADTENLTGSPHGDVLIGNAGPNLLAGGEGGDRLLGGAGVDTLEGGNGDDILQALDAANDVVACGAGEDGVVTNRSDVRTECDYIKYRVLAATSTAVRALDGVVRIPVRCSPATVEGCRGRASLKVGSRVIGSVSFRLTPGRRSVARIKLNRTGRARVRRTRVLKSSLVVRDRDSAGVVTRTAQTVRIGRR